MLDWRELSLADRPSRTTRGIGRGLRSTAHVVARREPWEDDRGTL